MWALDAKDVMATCSFMETVRSLPEHGQSVPFYMIRRQRRLYRPAEASFLLRHRRGSVRGGALFRGGLQKVRHAVPYGRGTEDVPLLRHDAVFPEGKAALSEIILLLRD